MTITSIPFPLQLRLGANLKECVCMCVYVCLCVYMHAVFRIKTQDVLPVCESRDEAISELRQMGVLLCMGKCVCDYVRELDGWR